MRIWTEAAKNAIRRHVARTGSPIFTRKALLAAELAEAIAETSSVGLTPSQTFTRELQLMRDDGLIQFVAPGTYRWLGDMPEAEPTTPSKGVLRLFDNPASSGRSEQFYPLAARWERTAMRMIGQWIVYQAPQSDGEGDYVAVARVARIDVDPGEADHLNVRVEDGSYLELGKPVPFRANGTIVERGLLDANGRLMTDQAARSIRLLSDFDFDRIVQLGIVTEEDLLPRIDDAETVAPLLYEERGAWEGPVDRATMLVSRTVRDRQFRKRILDVYGSRCALTGMKLVNGGGRVETEAAHIMSVEAGGPDKVNNGIALSGTIHWMFDRGLISLSDAGDILLSRAINDRDSVERLIFPDRKARFPASAINRPHPRYLLWHRTECFHD